MDGGARWRYAGGMLTRRALVLSGLSLPALSLPWPAAAQGLVPTPTQTEGPFYPPRLPADSDADLVRVAGRGAPAAGEVLHVTGRVVDVAGRAVAGARVEIWQCDARGVYHHPRAPGTADPNFQGFGRTVVDADGGYRFRAIRPVPYEDRTPHIHFRVEGPGFEPLVTQMYVAGEPLNERDDVLNNIRDQGARASVIVALVPAPEIEAGALKGHFDIVLGNPS